MVFRLTVYSSCDLYVTLVSYVTFWLQGQDFGLVVTVPAHCLSFTS